MIAIPALAAALLGSAPGMARIESGVYRPLFPVVTAATEVKVKAFELDRRPVTLREFGGFVAAHPKWRRGAAPRLLADDGYLRGWASADAPGAARLGDEPVTEVSYFAAREYCEARGARLPTEAEWELAAAAGDRGPDGRAEAGFTEKILSWYGRPATERRAVGSGRPNFWGVQDLHGLVWEWVEDFNAATTANDRDTQAQFCGAGAEGSGNREDYPSFMRAAFRSALAGKSTASSLGFRCARDVTK